MNRPLVTVLMPVFNGEKYLNDAIQSIIDQTYNNFEFLILDDGSTDNSVKIVKSHNDHRICHITSTFNRGIEKTLNEGLELAKGKYIARMDCDDISLPCRLHNQVTFMEQNPEVGVLSAAMQTIKNGRRANIRRWPTTDDEIKIHLLFQNPLSHPVIMLRKETLNGFYYPEDCKYAEDYRLWTMLSNQTKFANLPEVLLQYRIHVNQITKKLSSLTKSGARKARQAYISSFIHDISPEELLIHHQLSERDRNINLNNARQWLEKLALINDQKNFFRHDSFLSVLANTWWKCCKNNRTTGLATWDIYKSSFLSKIPLNEPRYLMIYMIKWAFTFRSSTLRKPLPPHH
jgi:glycosyltransferase involved in cell wall biosynthesis